MQVIRFTLALMALAAVEGVEPTAIQMDVQGGETRCLGDSVRVGEDTSFSFRAVEMSGKSVDKIKVSVEHPNGESYGTHLSTKAEVHHVDKKEGGGTYRVCFQNLQPKSQSARVELTETTVKPPDTAEQVKSSGLQPVEALLNTAQALADSLKAELVAGAASERSRIEEDNALRHLISIMAWFTVVVLFSVSGWQLMLLNKFFRSKKLI